MAFMSNYQNKKSDSNSITTSFTTVSSETSTLRISGWNQNISLRIAPTTGVNANGMREYSKDKFGQSALSHEKAKLLATKYEEEMKPLIEKYKVDGIFPGKQSISVQAGNPDKPNIISIEFDLDDKNRPGMFLAIYQNVGENGVAQQMSSFRHHFKTTPYLKNYNPGTGEAIKAEDTFADFNNFMDIIKTPTNTLPIGYHGQKYVTEWAEKLGGKSSFTNNNSMGGGFGTSNGFLDDQLPFGSSSGFSGSESASFFG